eukprot:1159658-Pelagomonas_calceolata.AAC.4
MFQGAQSSPPIAFAHEHTQSCLRYLALNLGWGAWNVSSCCHCCQSWQGSTAPAACQQLQSPAALEGE